MSDIAAAFELFVKCYPSMDAFDALRAARTFDRLTPSEQRSAVAGAERLSSMLRALGRRAPIDPAGWLRSRGWEYVLAASAVNLLEGVGEQCFEAPPAHRDARDNDAGVCEFALGIRSRGREDEAENAVLLVDIDPIGKLLGGLRAHHLQERLLGENLLVRHFVAPSVGVGTPMVTESAAEIGAVAGSATILRGGRAE